MIRTSRIQLGRRLRRGLLIPVVAAVVAGGALAYYASSGSGNGAASVGAINPPTNVVAKAGNGSTSSGPSPVTITWNAPSAGATPTGYKVVRDNGSTKVTISCSSSPCTDTTVPDGTYTYHVQSLLSTSWTSAAADSNPLMVVNDSTPPTTTITFPTNGTSYNATGFANKCSSGTVTGICGTATDPSGVASVAVAVENSAGKYWNGTSFVTSGTPIFNAADNTTSWSYGFAPPADDTYTVLVQATDGVGNTTASGAETTAAFLYDAHAPTVTLNTFSNGATNSLTPTFSGTAGNQAADSTHSADSNTVTVYVCTGTQASCNATSGSLIQTRNATRSGTSWSIAATTLTANATYTAQAAQSDGAANTGTSNVITFVVDTVAPSPTTTAPAAFVNTTTPTIAGTAGTQTADATHSADNTTVTVKIFSGAGTGGTLLQTINNVPVSSGTWSTTPSALTANAQYTAQVLQNDNAGNQSNGTGTALDTFVIDTTAPGVSMNSFTNNATNSPTPTFSGTAGNLNASGTRSADGTSVVVSVCSGSQSSCNSGSGSFVEIVTATRSGTSWSIAASPALTANATYSAQAAQSDGAGNTGTSNVITFVVDTVAPNPTLNTFSNNATNSLTPTFSGTAGNQAGDSTHSADSNTVTVYVCTGTQASCNATSGSLIQTRNATRSGTSWSIAATTLTANATYTAQAAQSDGAANTGTSNVITFVVDTVAPSPTTTAPAAFVNTTTPTISGTAGTQTADATHSADNTTVTVKIFSGAGTGGTLLQTINNVPVSSGTWSTTPSALTANAQYTAQVLQNDNAGNQSNGTGTALDTFVIDTTAPGVTMTGQAATGVSLQPTFSGSAGNQAATTSASADGTQVTIYVCTGTQSSCSQNSSTLAQTYTTTRTGTTWTFTPGITQALFTNTTYTAQAAQSDGAGNTGTSSVTTFTTTNTFTVSTAGTYVLTVAPHVTSFTFTIKGAGGGSATAAGAAGGSMSGTINVPDSSTPTNLNVVVGGGGGGESNVGGNGGNGCANGGAGGSHMTVGGAGGAATCILTGGNSPIVVVGGGGGGGDSAGGAGSGGNTGTNGSVSGTTGGTGGKTSPLTGGAGGNGDNSTGITGGANGSGGSDTHGSGGNGGAGSGGGNGGGGGGGGYASGGGGGGAKTGSSGGGGGGSGYSGGSGSFTVAGVSTAGTGNSGGAAGNHNGTDGSITFTGTGLTDPPPDASADPGPPPPISTDPDPTDTTSTDTTTTATTTTDTTTTETTTTHTSTTDTTTTDTTQTDTTSTDTATTTDATQTSATSTEGLSTPRQVLFFGVFGGSVLALVALMTMPIPRRRRARRRRSRR